MCEIPTWKNKTGDKEFEELAIILRMITACIEELEDDNETSSTTDTEFIDITLTEDESIDGRDGGVVDKKRIIYRVRASGGDWTLTLNTGAGNFRTSQITISETAEDTLDYIGVIGNSTDDRWDVVDYHQGFA